MISVNWHKFQAKVGDSAPAEFERLCYLIFCRKYNRPYGIFRYRDHPALETSPIEVDGELVGFQSKFFLDKFSNHKSDIIEAVEKVEKHYKELKRLIFFMPMDHDCNQNAADDGHETNAQREVENLAISFGFKIEWFCHSHFEATFSNKLYFDIGRHYFSDDHGMFALFDEIDCCKKRFLKTIHDSIEVGGKKFKIDRKELLKKIELSEGGTIFILYGEGGIGKSGVIKELIQDGNGTTWVFRPEEVVRFFSDSELSRSWHTAIGNVINETNDIVNRTIIVDSAEKIENLESDGGIFFAVIRIFVDAGWKVVFTIRTMFCDMLVRYLSSNMSSLHVQREMISPLTSTEIGRVESEFGIRLPSEVCTFHFLKIPFYLNIYIKNVKEFQKTGLCDFKKQIWFLVVEGGHVGDFAAAYFQRMVVKHIKEHDYWLDVSSALPETIQTLIKREILLQDFATSQYYIAHDVYEEIALEYEIEKILREWSTGEFFQQIPESRKMIRAFRIWLKDKLEFDIDSVKGVVRSAVNQVGGHWKNEALIAILNSSYAETFLAENKDRLFADKAAFLCSVIKLVRCACKEPRRDFPISELSNANLRYYLTKPSGRAWEVLILFICDNDACLHGFDLGPIVDFICEWIQCNSDGEVARKAGLFAMKVSLQDGKEFETHYDSWGNLTKIITASSKEIHNELQEFISFTLNDYDSSTIGLQREIYKGVLEHPYEHVNFIKQFPELTRQMAMAAWFKPRNHYYSAEWAEEVFGLSDRFLDSYVCPSAHATPIYILLNLDFAKTLDFLIEVVNKAVCHAAGWRKDDIGIKKTTISFPDGETVTQYISQPLWCMHRGVGSPVTPYLLQSIHMALERFFIDMHKLLANYKDKIEWLEQVAIGAIKKSKSASITSALNSLVLAYPDSYFGLASIIMTSREMIKADHTRGVISEAECKSLYDIYGNRNDVCIAERRLTLEDKFRSETLESVMLRYQMEFDDAKHERRQKMFTLLDKYGSSLLDEDRFFVLRADSRKRHVEKYVDCNGRKMFLSFPDVPEDLTKTRKEAEEKVLPNHICQNLMMWGMAKIRGEKIADGLMCYENNMSKTLDDFRYVLGLVEKADPRIHFVTSLVYPASALLLFHAGMIEVELRSKCERIILECAGRILKPNYFSVLLDGVDAALAALPLLTESKDAEVADAAMGLILFSMLCENRIGMENNRICDAIFTAVRNSKSLDQHCVDQYITQYLYLRTHFQKYLLMPQNRMKLSQCTNPLLMFLENNEELLTELETVCSFDINEVVSDPDAVYSLGNAILLITPTKENVKTYEKLIIGSIIAVLSNIYANTKDKHTRGVKYLEAFAVQYQLHLAKMLVLMDSDTLQASISEILKIPHIVDDHWFLSAVIAGEDERKEHDNFWCLWSALISPIDSMLRNSSFECEFDNNSVLEHFFLGKSLWKSNVTSREILRDEDVVVYSNAIKRFPASLGCLAALASFCNGIGSKYWREIIRLMVVVIAKLKENSWWHDSAMKRTVGKMEEFVLNVVLNNAEQIKKNDGLWENMIVVLDWLVDQQSNVAYQLREQLI